MKAAQRGKANDRDLAPPILLGVFADREVSRLDCAAPRCADRAVGFLTVLWRGIVAIPVCHDCATEALRLEKLPIPAADPVVNDNTPVIRHRIRAPSGRTLARSVL